MTPERLIEAIDRVWSMATKDVGRGFELQALMKTCRELYPTAATGMALDIVLHHALQRLGFDERAAGLASTDVAAKFHNAVLAPGAVRRHFCPLDSAGDLPDLSFGPNHSWSEERRMRFDRPQVAPIWTRSNEPRPSRTSGRSPISWPLWWVRFRRQPPDDQLRPDANPNAGSPSASWKGCYIVVRGRLWRTSNPNLSAEQRQALVDDLMTARRSVRAALKSGDHAALARAGVQTAKVGLGERGPVWWADGAPDLNRLMAKNTAYAAWFASLSDN